MDKTKDIAIQGVCEKAPTLPTSGEKDQFSGWIQKKYLKRVV